MRLVAGFAVAAVAPAPVAPRRSRRARATPAGPAPASGAGLPRLQILALRLDARRPRGRCFPAAGRGGRAGGARPPARGALGHREHDRQQPQPAAQARHHRHPRQEGRAAPAARSRRAGPRSASPPPRSPTAAIRKNVNQPWRRSTSRRAPHATKASAERQDDLLAERHVGPPVQLLSEGRDRERAPAPPPPAPGRPARRARGGAAAAPPARRPA